MSDTEALRWFRRVANVISDPVLLLRPPATVLAYNDAAGATLEELALDIDLLGLAEDSPQFARYLELAARSGSPLPGTFRRSTDETKWRCEAAAVTESSQRAIILRLRPNEATSSQRFATLTAQVERLNNEVAKRRRLETEREALVADLERAGRFRDDLLASVSHELRTPIHAISGWVALLRESPHDRGRIEQGLKVIERNITAQNQLVNDLTDTSLIISGRMRLEVSRIELGPIVRDAVETIRPAALAKQQGIDVDLGTSPCVVDGDPERMLQVVWNLVSNAVKYTPKGGTVHVALRSTESHAEIEVRDTGPGIGPEFLPYLFDRFSRGDRSSTRRVGGLGLGLAIVRQLVELHGGVITVDSDVGRGATFCVSVPRPLSTPESALDLDGSRETKKQLTGLRVLLAEDHEDSRELVATLLRTRGADVTAVEDGQSALEAFERSRPDILVSDIEMPGMDGMTLLRRIRATESPTARTLAAVALSAHSTETIRVRALEAGFQAFIAKPVKTSELIALISGLVRLGGSDPRAPISPEG